MGFTRRTVGQSSVKSKRHSISPPGGRKGGLGLVCAGKLSHQIANSRELTEIPVWTRVVSKRFFFGGFFFGFFRETGRYLSVWLVRITYVHSCPPDLISSLIDRNCPAHVSWARNHMHTHHHADHAYMRHTCGTHAEGGSLNSPKSAFSSRVRSSPYVLSKGPKYIHTIRPWMLFEKKERRLNLMPTNQGHLGYGEKRQINPPAAPAGAMVLLPAFLLRAVSGVLSLIDFE